jgi:hypothetical protein
MATMEATLLSFTGSPLAEAVLERMTAKLLQEELQIKRISSAKLARKLGVPLALLEDAIKGEGGLKVGVWKAIGGVLKLKPENYQFRPRKSLIGGEGWELYNIFVVPID